MLGYVLKRLLGILPTVWLICSIVFLLSQLVPGTFADRQRALADQERLVTGIGSTSRFGRPLAPPAKSLFYFSWRTSAEPDTLHRLQPAAHRAFLKNLIFTYGDWPAIAGFYHALVALQKTIDQAPTHTTVNQPATRRQLERIFAAREASQVVGGIERLQQQAQQQLWPANYVTQLNLVQRRLAALKTQAWPGRNLIPALAWHGSDNRYHVWLKQLGSGHLGRSYRDQRPVSENIAEAFQHTFFITVISLGLLFGLALELGVWLSKAGARNWRQPVLALLYALDSVPLFIVALFLLTVFSSAAYFNIFPMYGSGPAAGADVPYYLAWWYQLPSLVLPVLSLTLVNLPYVTGQIYQAMQHVRGRDFILTARAKGLSERSVLRQHVLRNALLPVITLFTGFLPALVSGAVVIEIIYAIPGTGWLLNNAVLARDFPVLIGLVLCVGLVKVVAHIIADVLYYLADPRIRLPTGTAW